MKVRNVTFVFVVLIAILIVWNFMLFQESDYHTVDVTQLNENYKQIVAGIEQGEDRNKLEDRYQSEIILKSDEDYDRKVMKAIKDNKILMDYLSEDQLLGKFVFAGESKRYESLRHALKIRMLYIFIFLLLTGFLFIGLIFYSYIRPFRKLQQFSSNVAKGDLDSPLMINKGNYFGAFTESFDLMREQLKLAKENEYKANVSKKELVAELSHDMKTPIATIKATCEVLKIKAAKAEPNWSKDILDKVDIIAQKSDMIDQLIGNMFHATLEELKNLKVEPEEVPSTIIVTMFDELRFYGAMQLNTVLPECLIYMDTLRFKQVIDNIVNNSYKYAGTKIDVSFREQAEGIVVEIRDYGLGVQEDELPLITEKYFRGKNGKGKSGAGLGLFLAKYFMENMKGALEYYNDNGFVVNLFLRKV